MEKERKPPDRDTADERREEAWEALLANEAG